MNNLLVNYRHFLKSEEILDGPHFKLVFKGVKVEIRIGFRLGSGI